MATSGTLSLAAIVRGDMKLNDGIKVLEFRIQNSYLFNEML